MRKLRLRALVLAAGHGHRLRPLTAFVPKPLLPIQGKPVVAHTLEALAAAGCEAIALNLHFKGDSIRRALGDLHAGVPLTYSEEDELLGTLGALTPLRGFLRQADLILIVNGDSLCRWPFRKMLRRHVRSRADATLLVSRRADVDAFGGGVGVANRRRIVSMRPARGAGESVHQRFFMGAHVISPGLLVGLSEGPADFVTDLYEPLLAGGGKVTAVESSLRWHDLGTPERFRRAALDLGRRRLWIAPGTRIPEKARIERSVLEIGARVGDESRVSGSVILGHASIGEGCRVLESIVGPGVELPPHTSVERRLVTTVHPEAATSEGASIVGGLVYEPI